jgi:hypothetical protein
LAGTPGSATITATLGASSTTSTVISTAAPHRGEPGRCHFRRRLPDGDGWEPAHPYGRILRCL